jgi:hypothetical protein
VGSQISGGKLTFLSARCLASRSDFGYLSFRATKYEERFAEDILESGKRVEYKEGILGVYL